MGKPVSRRSVARDSPSAQHAPKSVDRIAGVSRIGAIGKGSVQSRGKRKRSEKRARAERKQDFIDAELSRLEAEAGSRRAALASRTSQYQRSSALAGLSVLANALDNVVEAGNGSDDAAETYRPVQKVVHEKARRQILAEESVQVRNVLEHPSYQDDPMEALRQHLMNTVQDDPLSVPEAFGSTVHQREKQRLRQERKGSVSVRRKKNSVNKIGSSNGITTRKSGEKPLAPATKARNGGIKKNARSAERVKALGRIGVPRPKLGSTNREGR